MPPSGLDRCPLCNGKLRGGGMASMRQHLSPEPTQRCEGAERLNQRLEERIEG